MATAAAMDLPYSPVPRATMKDHVYVKLRELILNGGIEPGRTVTVQRLSAAFGVSAMPVREAMHRLVVEKALTVVRGRSVGIPPLTAERLEDLRRVRIEVEGLAVKWAAETLTPKDFSHLEDLIEVMRRAKANGDRRYVPANRDFHFTIYRAAASATLLPIIESLWLQIGPYFNLLNARDDWHTSFVEHKAILAALRQGNTLAAQRALEADIDGAASALRRLLASGERRSGRRSGKA